MNKIIYIPLEYQEQRYTTHLDEDIVNYLELKNIKYERIYPEVEIRELKPGQFLEASSTIEFKCKQISEISKMYYNDTIIDGDVIFFSDLWFPGIESISYLNYFFNKNVKIRGIIHAGSFTDTDSIRELERWAKNFEDIIFDISDVIFVGSEFIRNEIIKKRIVNPDKLVVTNLPLDYKYLNKYKIDVTETSARTRENIIVFNGRNHPEKQPWLYKELKEKLKGKYEVVWTQELNLKKLDYYELLSRSKFVVSFALQENFGYGIAEAVYLGNIPILPNRLVYPELYPKNCLYENPNEIPTLIEKMENTDIKISWPLRDNDSIFEKWFK